MKMYVIAAKRKVFENMETRYVSDNGWTNLQRAKMFDTEEELVSWWVENANRLIDDKIDRITIHTEVIESAPAKPLKTPEPKKPATTEEVLASMNKVKEAYADLFSLISEKAPENETYAKTILGILLDQQLMLLMMRAPASKDELMASGISEEQLKGAVEKALTAKEGVPVPPTSPVGNLDTNVISSMISAMLGGMHDYGKTNPRFSLDYDYEDEEEDEEDYDFFSLF